MSVAMAVFQPAMFWLNADAVSNICKPHRTMTHQAPNQRDTSRSMPAEHRHAPAASAQASRPGSAAKGRYARMAACDANEHTPYIVETLAVFQHAMFWLKADAE